MFNETDEKVISELLNKKSRTLEQVAESVGVSVRHLNRIRNKPAVAAEIRRIAHEATGDIVTLALPDIARAMVKKAVGGDVKAAALLLQMQGLLIDRKEIIATHINATSDFDDMSRDEISERMAEIQRELAAPKRIEVIDISPAKEYGFN